MGETSSLQFFDQPRNIKIDPESVVGPGRSFFGTVLLPLLVGREAYKEIVEHFKGLRPDHKHYYYSFYYWVFYWRLLVILPTALLCEILITTKEWFGTEPYLAFTFLTLLNVHQVLLGTLLLWNFSSQAFAVHDHDPTFKQTGGLLVVDHDLEYSRDFGYKTAVDERTREDVKLF